jgi:hypothetical protein
MEALNAKLALFLSRNRDKIIASAGEGPNSNAQESERQRSPSSALLRQSLPVVIGLQRAGSPSGICAT